MILNEQIPNSYLQEMFQRRADYIGYTEVSKFAPIFCKKREFASNCLMFSEADGDRVFKSEANTKECQLQGIL
jgi:hypothetical protein